MPRLARGEISVTSTLTWTTRIPNHDSPSTDWSDAGLVRPAHRRSVPHLTFSAPRPSSPSSVSPPSSLRDNPRRHIYDYSKTHTYPFSDFTVLFYIPCSRPRQCRLR